MTGSVKAETLGPLRGQAKTLGSSLTSSADVGGLKPLNSSLGGSLGDTKGTHSLPSKSFGSLKPVCHYNILFKTYK